MNKDTPQTMLGKLIQKAIAHFKEKPVTEEEIKQLRLEAEKYRLKADIAKSKAKISSSRGTKSSQGGSSFSRKSRYANSYSDAEDRISRLLRGAVGANDADLENDDESEKKSYRKRILGL